VPSWPWHRRKTPGLDPVRTLVSLQKNLQAHRGLAAMVLSGNTTVDAERRARQADVNTQFAALDKQLTALGYSKAADPAKAMKSGWDQLSQKVDARSINAKDSFEAHTALVEQNIAVIEMVADASGLSLDPVAESYYVMTAVVDHLPRLAEAIEVLRTGGIDALDEQGRDAHHAGQPGPPVARRARGSRPRSINQLAKAGEIDVGVAKALEVRRQGRRGRRPTRCTRPARTSPPRAPPPSTRPPSPSWGRPPPTRSTWPMTAATEVLEKLLHVRIEAQPAPAPCCWPRWAA
jgi:hypothetical protein